MSSRVSNWIVLMFGLIFFIADRILKYLASHHVLENNFLFSYTQNVGIAFGLMPAPSFLIISYILLILFLVAWLINNWRHKKCLSFPMWLILLGAMSNLLDRLRFGFVIDYIDLKIWPVFNLADMIIVLGVILFLIQFNKPKTN